MTFCEIEAQTSNIAFIVPQSKDKLLETIVACIEDESAGIEVDDIFGEKIMVTLHTLYHAVKIRMREI